MKIRIACCMGALLVQGCVPALKPDESTPVGLADALHVLQDQLQGAAPVTLGTIDTNAGKEEFAKAAKQAQCADKIANPLMPVITGAISVALQGSITKASAGTLTASLTPSGAYQYTVTRGQQQQVTVPLTFVPLSGIPNFYLGQNLANLNGLSDDQKKPFISLLMEKRKKLDTEVTKAIDAGGKLDLSNPDICPPPDQMKSVVVPYSLHLS